MEAKSPENSGPRPISHGPKKTYPVLPLNNMIGLPGDHISFTLQNSSLIKMINDCFKKGEPVFTTCTRKIQSEDPSHKRIFGSLAHILEITDSSPKKLKFRLHFFKRAELKKMHQEEENSRAEIDSIEKKQRFKEQEKHAITEEVNHLLTNIHPHIPTLHLQDKLDFNDIDSFVAQVAKTLEFTHSDKLKLLEGWSVKKRLDLLLELLSKYNHVHKLRKRLREKTMEKIKKMEKDAFLNEQKKIIENELNRSGKKPCPPEFQEIRDRIDIFEGPEDVLHVLQKEFTKLMRTGASSPHSATIQDYIETLLELPWVKFKHTSPMWQEVEKKLRKSHFGLDDVKEKILRFLAINHISDKKAGSIICFVGPPGVGKTSFARAIADALGLPYVKASLGGVRDESEIRGHRRTYVGSMPGRIIQGMKRAGFINPVFLLDEVDKMGHDHRGHPSDSLLEVLDTEENFAFSDHYIEIDYNLSKVFWILTANSEAAIPAPLRDRMEIIRFSGYTEYEKTHIASEYLIRKNMEKYGLSDKYELRMTETVCRKLIRQYTREAGVRELNRKISNIVQHFALNFVRGSKRKKWTVTNKSLNETFGPIEYKKPNWTKGSWVPGVIAGLAWTPTGGSVMRMECSLHQGKGNLLLTGKLGEVMKESAHTAFSFIKNNKDKLKLDCEFQNLELHIHIPSGSVSKEGPSAGMGLALLIYSILANKKSLPFWALTGEISLHGKVLAIGGVREKLLAAQQEGFTGVVLPKTNRAEVEEIAEDELGDLKIIYASDFWEAFRHFFG